MELQPRLLASLFSTLAGFDADFEILEPATIDEVIAANLSTEVYGEFVDLMLAMEVVCNPIPPELAASIESWATALGVASEGLEIAREIVNGATARAHADFYRTNYLGQWAHRNDHFEGLIDRYGEAAFCFTVEADPDLEAKYEALRLLPAGSLGREEWNFYKQRGFPFPGVVGGANLALAQHDWIHVLCGFDTDGIGECEAGAFRAMASDFPGSTLAFLGDFIFYQSAWFDSLVSGRHAGHELEAADVPDRLSDAIRRGKSCSIDPYIGIDFFDFAGVQLDDLCRHWSIPPKAKLRQLSVSAPRVLSLRD
ncbi:MAG: hypothetical protein WCK41_10575 [Actinomycetes bacterium]